MRRMPPDEPCRGRRCPSAHRGRRGDPLGLAPAGKRFVGFSLIELMVVVALIGIMTALIVPEMRGTYEDALLRSTSRELVGVCSLASSRAVSLNQLLRVRLDKRTGHYAIEQKVRDRKGGSAFIPVRDVPFGEGQLDTRIAIEIRKPGEGESRAESDRAVGVNRPEELRNADREEAIAFYPDGTADPGEILLQDRGGFRLVLRVNPVTARIRVVELEPP